MNLKETIRLHQNLRDVEKVLKWQEYKDRFGTYLANRDYITDNPHLLSGFKRLDFTQKQLDVIQKHLIEDKSFKETASELDVSESSVRNHYKLICQKLDDEYTSIWWSETALKTAKDTYSSSLSAIGFSNRVVRQLVRQADVTNKKEFTEKSLEDYKKLFGSSKVYDEILTYYPNTKSVCEL